MQCTIPFLCPNTWSGQDGYEAVYVRHRYLFILASLVYVPAVFYGPRFVKRPWNIKPLLIAWNLALSAFSAIGFLQVGGNVLARTTRSGWTSMICDTDVHDTPVGFWVLLFVASKLPELVDTVWLILRKREVILLHWYHHIMTMLYCWYAMSPAARARDGAGVVFSAVNLGVHTIMYAYFAAAVAGYGRIMSKMGCDVIITTVQLAQMALGLYVLFSARACAPIDAGWCWGVAMYASYLFLFAQLFRHKYCGKRPIRKKQV